MPFFAARVCYNVSMKKIILTDSVIDTLIDCYYEAKANESKVNFIKRQYNDDFQYLLDSPYLFMHNDGYAVMTKEGMKVAENYIKLRNNQNLKFVDSRVSIATLVIAIATFLTTIILHFV